MISFKQFCENKEKLFYHGARKKFNKIKAEKLGWRAGATLGKGFYFTDDKTMAGWYGNTILKLNVDTSKILNVEKITDKELKKIASILNKKRQEKGKKVLNDKRLKDEISTMKSELKRKGLSFPRYINRYIGDIKDIVEQLGYDGLHIPSEYEYVIYDLDKVKIIGEL